MTEIKIVFKHATGEKYANIKDLIKWLKTCDPRAHYEIADISAEELLEHIREELIGLL